jgi:hypothetical protein
MKVIVTSEEQLKALLKEVVSEALKEAGKDLNNMDSVNNDELYTSLYDISRLFNCSLPTAQKIKHAVPRDKYTQCGRTFCIKKSVLLSTNENLYKK